jgi:zinc transport system permease protein
MNILESIQFYFQFSFVRYALIVGVMIALSSSLLGVILVLKRYSFIGDGLSHVAFGAMAVGTVLNLSGNTFFVMGVTIITAIILLSLGSNAKIKGDAAIAMLSVGALAVGYMIMNIFSTSANVAGDVCSTLFGSVSILTLEIADVWLCIIASVIVIVIFAVFYNKIFAVTFDENYMKATGMGAGRYNTLIAVVTAIIIVLAMNLVGSLLISALIIFPALSAMRLLSNFKGVVILSAVISVICTVVGILTSILASTPVGATIVMTDLIAFIICIIIERFIR